MTHADEPAGGHTNRLNDATSPYLQQHAHNPVDWYPWGDEALARARSEDRPIFLSIGYSSCHWCHVMERESFEDVTIADLMNQHFVNIKVDREERPDLDEIYMSAVQAMTGQGGWPMSVFLTPDLRPFFGGTYFPPDDQHGRPGFRRLLMAVADAYANRRAEVDEGATRLTDAIRTNVVSGRDAAESIDAGLPAKVAEQLVGRLDRTDGGFGGAPKFPQAMNLSSMLLVHERAPDPQLEHAIRLTLDRMARGGIYDHLAGGFHRYSVDPMWLVPHFEKMLYDNALLVRSYVEAYQLFGDPFYRRVATETLDYVLREMTSDEGGFYSATDADSEGVEGKFFVWTPAELDEVLGAETAELFGRFYDVTTRGNFEGASILRVMVPETAFAEAEGIELATLESTLAGARAELLAVRARRVAPFLDDKVITSWNALMLGSFARAYRGTGDDRYRSAAVRCGELIVGTLMHGERLYRTRRQGSSQIDAYLEDYAFTADAFIDLYEATFDARWLTRAIDLVGVMNTLFWDEGDGAYCFTASDGEELLVRSKSLFDNAIPSGNSVAVMAQVRLARLTGDGAHLERAERVLRFAHPLIERAAGAFGQMLMGLDLASRPSRELVFAGSLDDSRTQALIEAAGRRYLVHSVTAHTHGDGTGAPDDAAALDRLVEGKTVVDGQPAAYLCRDFACQAPVTSTEALTALLEPRVG